MKATFVTLFLLAVFNISSAQHILNFHIVDDANNKPVEYAHVYVEKYVIGTVTNSDGSASVSVPDSLIKGDLVISSIGYASQRFKISHISFDTIRLTKASFILDPIVINAKYDSARVILQRVAENYKANYPRRKYYMDAFFRELGLKDSTYTRIIEASVNIRREPYKRRRAPEARIEVEKIRKSNDNRNYDLNAMLVSHLSKPLNKLYEVFLFDMMQYFDKPMLHFFGDTFIDNFDFNIEGIEAYGSDTLVIISYESRNKDFFSLKKGEIYINTSDWAIVKMTWEEMPNNKEAQKLAYQSKWWLKSECHYIKHNGKYYIQRISAFKMPNDAYVFTSNKMKDGVRQGQQYDLLELIITGVYGRSNRPFNVRRSNAVDQHSNLYNVDMEYDREFWEGYNILKLNPADKKVFEHLSSKGDLQFKNN